MKMSIKGFIHSIRLQDYDNTKALDVHDRHRFSFFLNEDVSFLNYVKVCPHVMEFEIPDAWNPVVDEIKILKTKRDEVAQRMQDEMFKKLDMMDTEISKLQCLEYDKPKDAQ